MRPHAALAVWFTRKIVCLTFALTLVSQVAMAQDGLPKTDTGQTNSTQQRQQMPQMDQGQMQSGNRNLQSAKPPPASQPAGPGSDLLTEDMRTSEKMYREITSTLKKPQTDLLKEMEFQYIATIGPDILVTTTALQLKQCEFKSEDQKQKAATIYKAYKSSMEKNKEELRKNFDKQYIPQVSFMDPKMVMSHLNVLTYYAKTLKTRQIKMSIQNAQDKQAVCKHGMKTLQLFAKG